MRKILPVLLTLLLLVTGCSGGQEIESCLFVIAMAVDAAPDGGLTVTIKALSGAQDDASAGSSTPEQSGGESSGQSEQAEAPEPGYITLSATAPTCLRALNLLSATTPRTVNLSQLQEIVLSRTLAESGAALSVLEQIHAMYRANGAAVVVVTPDDAGDFVRRQHALLGVRLSKYLKVLFEHFSQIDTIPPDAQLASVLAAMKSGTHDAAAVYAAGNDFSSTLMLPGSEETDRLPGHLPRTSPAQNEYLGTALFSGGTMTGTLTGSETSSLCLMMGRAQSRTVFAGGAQYRVNRDTRVKRSIDDEGALCVDVRVSLTLLAGEAEMTEAQLAADIEGRAAQLMQRLQAASCDAPGFGRVAVRTFWDIPSWEAQDWQRRFEAAPIRVRVRVKVV